MISPRSPASRLLGAYERGKEKGLKMHVGNVFTSDVFYREDKSVVEKLMRWGSRRGNGDNGALHDCRTFRRKRPDDPDRKRSFAHRGRDFFRGAANDV